MSKVTGTALSHGTLLSVSDALTEALEKKPNFLGQHYTIFFSSFS